jgi:hypothetical protein
MTQSYEDIYEDKHDKYMEKYRAGEISFFNVEERARASADRAQAAGGYVRQAPAQQPLIDPFPQSADHSSIDGDDVPANDRPGQQRVNAEGDYIYDDNVDDMFAAAGGLGSFRGKRAEGGGQPAPGPERKKLGLGSRLWNGAKGVWGAVKNFSGYNLVRHGIAGAFRKSKIRKNEAKLAAARDGLDAMKSAGMAGAESDYKRGEQLQTQFNEAERKLHYNRAKLGMHRKYRTGRVMKNEWSRLFTGRDVEDNFAEKRYFQGLGRTSGVAAAPVDASAAGNSSQVNEAPVAAPGGSVQAQPDVVQELPTVPPQPEAVQAPIAGHDTLEQPDDLMRESGPVQDDRYGSAQLNNFMYNDNLDDEDDD